MCTGNGGCLGGAAYTPRSPRLPLLLATMRHTRFITPTALIAGVALVAACAKDSATPPTAPAAAGAPGAPLLHISQLRGANQAIQMCKVGPPGRYTFTLATVPANVGTFKAGTQFDIVIAPDTNRGCFQTSALDNRIWATDLGQSYDVDVIITELVPPGQRVSGWQSFTNYHDAWTGQHLTPQPNTNILTYPASPSVAIKFKAEPNLQNITYVTVFNDLEPVVEQPVRIGDFVWNDLDADGVQDAGEPGIAGVTVTITGPNGPHVQTTDANGYYDVGALVPGTYTVSVATPAGFVPSPTGQGTTGTDSDANGTSATLASGESASSIDFGFYQARAGLGDRVWHDLNANGVQDAGEPGFPKTQITISGPSGTLTTTADAIGAYGFANLIPGCYTVTRGLAPGHTPSPTGQGTPSTDSDASPSTVCLAPGESNTTVDFGIYEHATLGDFVWVDTDGDGVQDAGEPGIAGATVTLSGPGGTQSTTTDANGLYRFDGLTPGAYTVSVATPAGYVPSPSFAGGDPAKDSNGSPAAVTLVSTETNLTIDFGFAVKPPDEILGLEGCTPGYWKQPQHFGSWAGTGLTPTDSYNAVFGVTAWPASFTLLDALGKNGGGINALARHSTAALLNARSTGVDYGLTSSAVIAATQLAISTRSYDGVANHLMTLNEKGCPLARDEGGSTSNGSGKKK